MSTPTENSPETGEHDLLLDYAYGELEAAGAAQFEKHLETCVKCRGELDMMKRVRSAVRVALPLVEPPAAVTGALHAQLLHAAAQRRPADARGGGKVLAFTRRVLRHPGYAAAAGLLIVGGAIGLQWSRGHLDMPPRAEAPAFDGKHESETAKVAAAPAGPEPGIAPATAVAPKPTEAVNDAPAAKLDQAVSTPNGTTAAADKSRHAAPGYYAGNEKKKEPSIYLETREGAAPLKVARAAKGKDEAAFGDSVNGLDGSPAQAMGTGRVSSRSVPDPGNSNSVGGSSNSLGSFRGAAGGARRDAMTENKPAARPMEKAPAAKQEEQKALAEVSLGKGAGTKNAERYAEPPPPAPPAAAPTVQATAPVAANAPPPQAAQPSAPARSTAALQQPAAADDAKSQQYAKRDDNSYARTADTLRKKAEEAASSGRCDEAVKLYQELDQRFPRYSVAPRDRLPYVRCLRQTGQEQLANDVLSALKDDNARMQGQVLDESTRATAHRAKKAAPPAAKPTGSAPAKAAAPTAVDSTLK